jgi:hypothetical protein
MGNLTKEQWKQWFEGIAQIKQLISEKGSKAETVDYLVQETGLSKEFECNDWKMSRCFLINKCFLGGEDFI